MVSVAGIVVVVGYPLLLGWILVNQIRWRRLLDARGVPAADGHIHRARQSYEAAIQQAQDRLMSSEVRLQREGVTEVRLRIETLKRAEVGISRLRRATEKEYVRGQRALKRGRGHYLETLCALDNAQRLAKVHGLVGTLIDRERTLEDQLRRVIEGGEEEARA